MGYVYEVNENTMLMKLITTKGYESGFVTFFVDDIQKISMDGFYEKRIARLMKEYDLSYEELDKIPTTGNPIRDIIAYAQNKKTILTIITDNNETIFCKNMELHNDYIFADSNGIREFIRGYDSAACPPDGRSVCPAAAFQGAVFMVYDDAYFCGDVYLHPQL